jgi:hypothetical protein
MRGIGADHFSFKLSQKDRYDYFLNRKRSVTQKSQFVNADGGSLHHQLILMFTELLSVSLQ